MLGRVAQSPLSWPRVAIIGAGISGIAVGVNFFRAGLANFEIFESEDGVGGTWRVNTYPGASVDVPSAIYQFGFKTHPWKRTHATQAELLEYLENIAREYELFPHCRFNTRVVEARWSDIDNQYDVITGDGGQYQYDFVISAVGFLSVPKIPDWPGLPDFTGPVFHTAGWDHDVDLSGKRVAIVGVGSSSTQVVPAIQSQVAHLYVFQREPGWVLPKGQREFSADENRLRASSWRRQFERAKMNLAMEWSYIDQPVHIAGSKRNVKAEAMARSYIEEVFAERADLRELVTPKYAFSGKRRIISDDYYPALLHSNVELVARPVMDITKKGLIDVDGTEYPVDVIIIATGFKAASYLSELRVTGRGGVDLHQAWADEPYALVGMSVPGFPNFYMLYGPGTNGTGALGFFWLAEQEVAQIVREIRRASRRRYVAIDTRPRAARAYDRWMQRRLHRTAWNFANNYMKSPSGRIVTQFSGSATLHWLLLRFVRPLGTFGWRSASAAPPPAVDKMPPRQSLMGSRGHGVLGKHHSRFQALIHHRSRPSDC